MIVPVGGCNFHLTKIAELVLGRSRLDIRRDNIERHAVGRMSLNMSAGQMVLVLIFSIENKQTGFAIGDIVVVRTTLGVAGANRENTRTISRTWMHSRWQLRTREGVELILI